MWKALRTAPPILLYLKDDIYYYILLYIYYIHPELRIGNYRFRSEKGVGPL